jgi:hypothetical protein
LKGRLDIIPTTGLKSLLQGWRTFLETNAKA